MGIIPINSCPVSNKKPRSDERRIRIDVDVDMDVDIGIRIRIGIVIGTGTDVVDGLQELFEANAFP